MSVPPDLMAALQTASGGGQQAAPAGGLPPELMSQINQDAQTLDPTQPNPGQQQPAREPAEILQDVLSALDEYKNAEQDQVDLAEAAKIYALIQKLLAKDQQEREAAAGVTPAHKGMAKAYGVGPAAQGAPPQ